MLNDGRFVASTSRVNDYVDKSVRESVIHFYSAVGENTGDVVVSYSEQGQNQVRTDFATSAAQIDVNPVDGTLLATWSLETWVKYYTTDGVYYAYDQNASVVAQRFSASGEVVGGKVTLGSRQHHAEKDLTTGIITHSGSVLNANQTVWVGGNNYVSTFSETFYNSDGSAYGDQHRYATYVNDATFSDTAVSGSDEPTLAQEVVR